MKEQIVVKGRLERRKESKWWYGVYSIDKTRYAKNLRVEIRGTPPSETEEHGSVHFEKSKSEAESELRNLLKSINSDKSAEEIAQAVHQARTGGRRVKVYKLSELPDLWINMPRNKPVSDLHRQTTLAWIEGFISYCSEHWPNITKLDHLSNDHARQYMQHQEERGISPRTWNAILGALKAACKRGQCTAFNDLRQKQSETVHRVPYSPEELKAIFDVAKSDVLLYPLVVTAACTAMRRGDCCKLKWTSVDLDEGFITVSTSKTGRRVDIPIADMFRDAISHELNNGSEFVFPALAAQYDRNAKVLTDRLRKVLAKIGYYSDDYVPLRELDDIESSDLIRMAEVYFSSVPTENKRENARRMLIAYLGGLSLCKAATAVGISKATGSAYLNEIERATGLAFIRGKKIPVSEQKTSRLGDVHLERKNGLRRASVRDFHSFRTTWITLALCSGIPFELVQQVTGHATAEIVLEHYFKPQRAQLKAALEKSMPSLLTAGNVNPVDRLPDLLRSMSSTNWCEIRDEALDILGCS
ncbi:hypothetical protein PDESU_04587 [Pontiella desulfatans]|uniref:Tyr recombinase domain-containing protein n=1 Tax=Pontiella desulfatans TaxID=2750659 RepID=A0A6C2U7E4_PONDE|nr:site-specific integrase [Pontiella desulfatans]VGO15998.1 hypothetical protein PDESU_04587 [Pontiella desulfatans]